MFMRVVWNRSISLGISDILFYFYRVAYGVTWFIYLGLLLLVRFRALI